MPPIDTSTDPGPVPVHPGCSGPGGDSEDTLDLRLPDEILAFVAGEAAESPASGEGWVTSAEGRLMSGANGLRPGEDRLAQAEHQLTPDDAQLAPNHDPFASAVGRFAASDDDLLDHVGDWGPFVTPVGPFQLVPVRLDRDLELISGWMNDPAVAAFWELAGSRGRTEDHLRAQLAGDGRSAPCVGVLDGTPMSYWEIYRADLDPLARHYPAGPHDTGVHLLVGGVADRGRGLGSALLRAVADLVLDHRPACSRVIAEPDLRNTPSVSAFLSAGFRFAAEVDLSAKRAALMIRDRSLRHLL